MSESKFLKYQDTDGDRLPDVCDEALEEVQELKKCPTCTPNPYAPLLDWKTQDGTSPTFNEKKCTFELTYTTPYTETIDLELFDGITSFAQLSEEQVAEGMDARYNEFADEVSETFLINNGKDSSPENIELLKESLIFADYDLSPRENSKLKLLYTVEFEDLAVMPDDPLEDEEDDDDEDDEDAAEEASGAGIELSVSYDVDELRAKIIRVRKGLNLYSKYLKVFRAIKKGNILFTNNNAVFDLEKYGDSGTFNNTTLGSILYYIDAFLNARGLNIPRVGPVKLFQDRVTKIEFDFGHNYKIVKMRVFVAGCGDAPKIFGRKKLKSLVENANKGVFRDPTAMAYFAHLDAMDSALQQREPDPWIDFLKEYTYPEVYDDISATNQQEPSTSSCVTNILAKEGKQFGQDILDDMFSLGDAVVWAFRDKVCLNEVGELQTLEAELGLGYDVSNEDINAAQSDEYLSTLVLEGEEAARRVGRAENKDALVKMAREQAYQTLQAQDTVLTRMCEKMLNVVNAEDHKSFNIRDLFEGGLEDIKLCGLFALLSESISCLFKNLTFEQAIGSIARSALNSMSIDNFENLFIGLPPNDRAAIDNLAKEKLESGDVFNDNSVNQRISDDIADNDPSNTSLERYAQMRRTHQSNTEPSSDVENSAAGGFSRARQSRSRQASYSSAENRRTIAQQLDPDSMNDPTTQIPEDTLIGAYANAMMEHYSDNLLGLVDQLNKYPGAQIVKRVLAFFDCPQDPILDPNIADFIKSVQLPICRSTHDITIPRIYNLYAWIPEINDWQAIAFELGKLAIRQAIVNAMVKLIIKICEILSGSVCKALQTTGDLIASLPELGTARDNFKNLLRENLCGSSASDGDLDNAMDDLLNGLGGPPNKLANEDDLKNFVTDYSNALTQSELIALSMGQATNDSLNIGMEMILTEHQNLSLTFPDRQSIEQFFRNVGNLFPADVRDQLNDQLGDPFNPPGGAGPGTPVNPTMCATPDQYEDFCNFRSALLEGRATKAQIQKMCDNQRDQYLDDLGDLGDVLQDGLPNYLDSNLPPMISEPGCDDGLFPFESPEAIQTAQNVISGEFEKLQIAYSKDMIGNGPFQKNYGLLNMVLSDTMGNPLTTHNRKTFLKSNYVDFYRDGGDDEFGKVSRLEAQRGAFPQKISEWLQYQMAGSNDADDLQNSITFSSNNDWEDKKTYSVKVSDLNMPLPVKYYNLPNFGYNTDFNVKFDQNAELVLTVSKYGRKATPDMTLSFKDNAKGLRSGPNSADSAYAYGFDIMCYYSDLYKSDLRIMPVMDPALRNAASPIIGDGIKSHPSDNIRIVIGERINEGAMQPSRWAPFSKKALVPRGNSNDEESAIIFRKYEMLCIEPTLDNFDFAPYPEFADCFSKQSSYIPQVVLLKEMINNNSWIRNITIEQSKSLYEDFVNKFTKKIFEEIADNDAAFNYGAKFDSLTEEDIDYVLGPGYGVYSGGLYGEALIEDAETGEMRKIVNDDMILGMSRMQYEIEESGTYSGTATENRVFYLDPTSYGRNYMSPAVYIKPEQNKGWLGIIDVLFPELNPCKPQVADFIDFDDIGELISSKYSQIPEDPRLESGGKDCVEELPYNRILDRISAASLEGLIIATVRIFCSVHLLKAFATFSKFKPSFPDVFSPLYAQHIVEEIEESLTDAQTSFEFATTFKDEEFYLAFLEQTVQMYGRKIDNGEIIDPPSDVFRALMRCNDSQMGYNYPSKKDLKEEKDAGIVRKIKTLKNFREDKKYQHVFMTKNYAKIVLRQVVVDELNRLADKLVNNMQAIDLKPEITNISYYFIENFVQGHTLSLSGGEFAETPSSTDIPTIETDDLYTSGGQFSMYSINDPESPYSVGDEYVGYYHVHVTPSGQPVYMVGEYHRDAPHDVIKPFADKIIVSNINTELPLGDILDWDKDYNGDSSLSSDQPFLLEKYIKINNTLYSPTDAVNEILSNEDQSLNLSDVYPGTLEQVFDQNDRVIGLTGELGVRYGLMLSVIEGGKKFLIMNQEIDALDFKISQFAPLEPDSKLLLCLINQMVDDDTFNVFTKYILGLSKTTSIAAIYNDLAFIPSIGEVTVDDGETYGAGTDLNSKPGSSITIEEEDGEISSVEESGKEGWASADNRTPGAIAGLFVNEWDKWDRVLLRNSKKMIKRMFNRYYRHGFEFSPGDLGELPAPGKLLINNLRNSLRPKPGLQLLPWWKLGALRTNPFNSEGDICENE